MFCQRQETHLGSLDKVTRVVRLMRYLATEGDFFAQPKVADAASELLRDVFGEDKSSGPDGSRRCEPSSGRAGRGWKSFSKSRHEEAGRPASSFEVA